MSLWELSSAVTTDDAASYTMPVSERVIGTRLVDAALGALKKEGISKVALLVFKYNEDGNAFWEAQGFTVRDDLNYRNKALRELVRIDT